MRVIAVTFCVTLAASLAARQGPTSMAAFQVCLQVWLAVSLLADGLAVAGQVRYYFVQSMPCYVTTWWFHSKTVDKIAMISTWIMFSCMKKLKRFWITWVILWIHFHFSMHTFLWKMGNWLSCKKTWLGMKWAIESHNFLMFSMASWIINME